MNLDSNSVKMGRTEKLFEQPSALSNELDWSSPVPDRDSIIPPKRDWKKRHRELRSDPQRYAVYLEKKRQQRLSRQTNKQYETERKRKWRAANREKDRLMHKAHYAVESALVKGILVRPERCQGCNEDLPLEAHHYLGYSAEHRLDIVWLCQMCHSKQHPTGFKSTTL